MTLLRFIAILGLVAFGLPGPAHAAYQPGAIVAPQPVANLSSITGGHWGPAYLTLHVAGAVSDSDGGQGDFAYKATSCAAYGPYCIQDADLNYYLRTNIDGTVQQVGAVSGSAYDWQANIGTASDITPLLTSMATGLAAAGIYTINTNGLSVHMVTGWAIPAGMQFTCGITPGVPSTGWYNSVPGAVYKAHGVLFDTAGSATDRGGCYIIADTITTKPTNAQTQNTQNNLILSNGDTGLSCSNEGCHDHDLWILGFDAGYDAQNAADSVLNNVVVDADVCFRMRSTGVAPRWSGTQCTPFLNRGITNNEEHFDITKIESGSGGVCHVTVVPAVDDPQAGILADLPYAPYMYIARLPDGPSSCENQYGGLWKINNINTGDGTFDLIASAVLGPTTFCHWAAGTKIIYCSDVTNVSNGLTLTASGGGSLAGNGIPDSTKSAVTWPLPPQENGFITDTGSAANTYVTVGAGYLQNCTLGNGANVPFIAAHTNTGASTLDATLFPSNPGNNNCTGGTTGALAIVRQDGSALQSNDIIAGAHELVTYCETLSNACPSGTLNKWVLIQPKVILDTATTLAQSSNIGVTFNGATCTGHSTGGSGCGNSSSALFLYTTRVDAGSSSAGTAAGGTGWATCMLIGGPTPQDHEDNDKVAGFQVDQSGCFDHTVEYHVENSNETGLTNFATDSHGNDDDPNPIIVLADGQVNNAHFLGRKASKGGRSIVVYSNYKNNSDRGAVTWVGASVASTNGALPVTDIEQGTFVMLGGDTNSSGVNLISNFASQARFDTNQPNVTNYYEGAAAQGVTTTLGSNLAGGESNPTFIANMAPSQTTSGTIDQTAVFWPCDATSGAVQLTLPVAATVGNQQFTVQKVDTSANTCKVVPGGSDTFLGGPINITLSTQGQYANFASPGGILWYIYPIAASNVIAQSGAALTVPADTSEDTLATVILPKNTMGANGCFIVDLLGTWTASTNAKTIKIYLGATAFGTLTTSSGLIAGGRANVKVCNSNATGAQIGGVSTTTFGIGGGTVTAAIDTTSNANIIITGQKASSGESLVVSQYNITVMPHN